MENKCKECGKEMGAFNRFYICVNPRCKLQGLLKLNFEKYAKEKLNRIKQPQPL
jgi:hypothetical protein